MGVGALLATVGVAGGLVVSACGGASVMSAARTPCTEVAGSTARAVASTAGPTQASWSAPEPVGARNIVEDTPPTVALDARGDAVAAWSEAALNGLSVSYAMRTSVRPAGGRWQSPTALSSDGLYPLVALDAAGDAIASWESRSGIPLAMRTADGVWSTPQILYSGKHRAPQVAGDARGDAIILWDGGGIHAAVRPAGGVFGPAQLITGSSDAQDPRVAMNARGDAIVAWLATHGQGGSMRAAFRPSGGRWSAPRTLSDPRARTSRPQVAIDGCGGTTIVWAAFSPRAGFIETAGRTDGGRWSSQHAIATVPAAPSLDVGMDTRGDATVVWSQPSLRGRSKIWTRTRSSRGRWSAAQPIPHAEGLSPSIAVDPRGNALLAWEGSEIEVIARPAGGHWQRVHRLSRRPIRYGQPRVVLDAQGDALVAWQDNSDLANASIETSVDPALFR